MISKIDLLFPRFLLWLLRTLYPYYVAVDVAHDRYVSFNDLVL